MTRIEPHSTPHPTAAPPGGTKASAAKPEKGTEGKDKSGFAFEVTLSDEAKAFLAEHPGKSVAHQARAALGLDEFKALAAEPFGKVVSALAHGLDLISLLPAPIEDLSGFPSKLEPEAPKDEASSVEATSDKTSSIN